MAVDWLFEKGLYIFGKPFFGRIGRRNAEVALRGGEGAVALGFNNEGGGFTGDS